MTYNVGDYVVYPVHGAGVIENIEERRVLGKTQKYYVMKMPYGSMTVMIPMNNLDGVGIRSVISSAEADRVLNAFEKSELEVNTNWNKRIRENMVKIKSGDIYEVAQVVKSLMMRERSKGLSTGERKMLTNAKQIFFSELVLAKHTTNDEMEKTVSSIIERQLGMA